MLCPVDYGLPDQFTSFRKGQVELATRMLASPKRFLAVSAPTGFGKSLLYILYHMMERGGAADGYRSVVLTADKGLQDQINGDFGSIGMVDMRGRNSFPCHGFPRIKEDLSCEDGALLKCANYLRKPTSPQTCPYKIRKAEFEDAHIGSSNYKYWAAVHAYTDGLSARDCIICDEAHQLINVIEDTISVKMTIRHSMQCPKGVDREEWKAWAVQQGLHIEDEIDRLKHEFLTELHMSMGTRRKLTKLM